MLQLYTTIKNDAPSGVKYAIWKFAGEDFKSGSQLSVNPSEEAIFVKDGKVENVFSEGRYRLSTKNYPFVQEFRSFASLGASAFSCKIYYIDKSDFMDARWGTTSPMTIIDPYSGLVSSILARGSYVIRIKDSEVFFRNYAGSKGEVGITKSNIIDNFRSDVLEKVRTLISEFVRNSKDDLANINMYLQELAETMRPKVSEFFDEYGLELKKFNIESIDVNMETRKEIEKKKAEKIAMMEEAKGERGVMEILGQNWTAQQGMKIYKTAAGNPNGVAGAFGIAALDRVGGGGIPKSEYVPFENESHRANTRSPAQYCPECGSEVLDEDVCCSNCGYELKKICPNCGKVLPPTAKFCSKCRTKLADCGNEDSKSNPERQTSEDNSQKA